MNAAKLILFSMAFGVRAASVNAASLSPEAAAGHIGEIATVCGVVVSAEYEANEQNQPTLLDLGKPYPNAIFTAVIYGDTGRNSGLPRRHSAASGSM